MIRERAGIGGRPALVVELRGLQPGEVEPELGSQILTIVPEPGTAALLGLGLVGLLLAARRRAPPAR